MLEKLKERKGEGGFTLIELLIVIIILAILAAIVIFAVGTTTKNASVSSCNSTVKSVETAVEAFKAQTGTFPAAQDGRHLRRRQLHRRGSMAARSACSDTAIHTICKAATGKVNVTVIGNYNDS